MPYGGGDEHAECAYSNWPFEARTQSGAGEKAECRRNFSHERIGADEKKKQVSGMQTGSEFRSRRRQRCVHDEPASCFASPASYTRVYMYLPPHTHTHTLKAGT